MTRIAVLGASGVTGSAIALALTAAGHEVVPLVRDPDRLAALRDDVGDDGSDRWARLAAPRTVDAGESATLRAALHDIDVLVSAVGPALRYASGILDTVVATGVHLVDLAAAPSYLRWAVHERDRAAQAAGVVCVVGAGTAPCVGDLLTAVAAERVPAPSEVHVAYVLPDGGHLGDATPGVRASLAAGVGRPVLALVDGELVEELAAEQRRLAWFPRPVGPHHAAAIPGGEPLTVPRHLPGVRTVRTYLAMPTWRAELAQMQANAARWERARRQIVGRLERGRASPSATRRAGLRFGAVAEVAGTDVLGRAWAYGHDPYEFAASVAVAAVERVVAGSVAPGVRVPAELDAAERLLDQLSAHTDLRWSRTSTELPDGL